MTRRKRDKVLAPTVEQRIGTNKQRIRPLLDKCCKDLIERPRRSWRGRTWFVLPRMEGGPSFRRRW
jgi:hypothetical protein